MIIKQIKKSLFFRMIVALPVFLLTVWLSAVWHPCSLLAQPPDRIIAYCGGFNAATLISVCINNIERIKTEE